MIRTILEHMFVVYLLEVPVGVEPTLRPNLGLNAV